MNKRIEWIDISKGIGIFLVIIGHTMLEPAIRTQIYVFHMPLFFLLSGFLFSHKKHPNAGSFTLAKAKSLLIPYTVFSFLSLYLGKILLEAEINLEAFMSAFLLSQRNALYFDEPLWFLTSLFTIEILFYFFVKYIKKPFIIWLAAAGLSILSIRYLNALTAESVLPWSLDQSLYYLFYFACGYVMKTTGLLRNSGKKSPLLLLASVIYLYLLVDNTIYTRIFQQISEIPYLPDSVFLFLNHAVWALLAILFVFYLSQFLAFSFVKFLGEKSLIFLALHISLGFNLTNYITSGRLADYIPNPNLLGLVYSIAAVLIVSPIAILITKYLPFLIGKSYNTARTKHKQPKKSYAVSAPHHKKHERL